MALKYKNIKILRNLCLHYARQDGQEGKNRKENKAIKVTKIPKAKRRKYGMNRTTITVIIKVSLPSRNRVKARLPDFNLELHRASEKGKIGVWCMTRSFLRVCVCNFLPKQDATRFDADTVVDILSWRKKKVSIALLE